MPYIGQSPSTGQFIELDALTASATDTYTLQLNSANFAPESVNNLIVSINGVVQKPSSMSLNGSSLTVGATLSSSDTIDYVRVLGHVGSVVTPTDGSVTAPKIASNAVTDAKLATSLDFQNITIKGGSTNAMTVDSSGRILTSARPSFCARPTAEITNQTSGDIIFGEAGAVNEASHGNHNVGGHYNTSTGKFVAPVTGIYFFSFSAMTYAENDCEVKMFLNTQDVIKFNTNLSNDESNYESFHGSTVIKMSASDFFHPQVAGGNFHASPNHSQFSGFLIG